MSDSEQRSTVLKSDGEWGVGDQAKAKPFSRNTVRRGGQGTEEIELIHGQYPHSTRDNNTYARYSDGTIVGFDGHRVIIDVELKSYNYLKSSYYSGDEIRKGGSCKISMNGDVVYSFFFRDPQNALREADSMIGELMEHPLTLWDKDHRDKAKGRAVYYRNTPATIDSVDWEDGELTLLAQEGLRFPPAAYEIDEAQRTGRPLEPRESRIRTDLFDKNIWWFRTITGEDSEE